MRESSSAARPAGPRDLRATFAERRASGKAGRKRARRGGLGHWTEGERGHDCLETLLAQRSKTGATLSASDSALARSMIEDSSNDSATSLWDAVGGGTGIGSFNAAAGLTRTTPSSWTASSAART